MATMDKYKIMIPEKKIQKEDMYSIPYDFGGQGCKSVFEDRHRGRECEEVQRNTGK